MKAVGHTRCLPVTDPDCLIDLDLPEPVATGRDLLSSRDGGVLVFTPPDDDTYLIKVHSLAYQGGDEQFYRLAVREASGEASPPREAGSRRVSSFSWPPEGLSAAALR